MHESALMREIRAAMSRSRKVTLWRNNVGFDEQHKVKYGLGLGSADLVGFVHGSGRFLAIEVKTPTGRLSSEQEKWGEHVRRYGGIYEVFRSVEEAEAWVK